MKVSEARKHRVVSIDGRKEYMNIALFDWFIELASPDIDQFLI